MLAIMASIVEMLFRNSNVGMLRTFSSAGCVAHSWICWRLLWPRRTAPNIRRACFLSSRAATAVAKGLRGLPSVITSTTCSASLRPRFNSALAISSATEVSAVDIGHWSKAMASLVAAMLLDKCCTSFMPHCFSMSGDAGELPVQALKSPKDFGPLKRITATWASMSSPSKDSTNFSANSLVISQPSVSRLPLPSKRSTKSTLDMHLRAWVGCLGQGCTLHGLRWSRSRLSAAWHLPRPVAGSSTCLCLASFPVLHSLEQEDHPDQSPSTQSLSQACMPHGMTSVMAPQGSPSYLAWTLTMRVRSLTPPPHSAEHALKPLHADSSQSTGQVCSLQERSIVSGGQATPPPLAGTTTPRLSCWTPPPQLLEQSSGCQSVTWQSWKNGYASPLILNSSPRIFFRAHISDSNARIFWLQEDLVWCICTSSSSCSCAFILPSSAAVFSPAVASASFVFSLLSLISKVSISASRVFFVRSELASSSCISCSSSLRLSAIPASMLRNLFCRCWHCGSEPMMHRSLLRLALWPPPRHELAGNARCSSGSTLDTLGCGASGVPWSRGVCSSNSLRLC
mmetsp:Transcript_25237/g.79599  ORF Transcript_25237/g.79599 Transcript_25237/m.79599 type:complete len:568 (-) Transcript_25237:953-2656(-)